MSNPYQQPIQPQPHQYNSPRPVETNGLGITGFVISLIGLFLCGVPSLIGLIISLLALGKQPKGFAIAGTILGGLGLLMLAATGFMLFATYRAAQTIGTQFSAMATELQMDQDAGIVGEQWKETGELPSQEEGQQLLGQQSDMFGNSLIYETDGASFTIRSAGPDGQANTEDDIVSGPYDDAQNAIDVAAVAAEQPDFGLEDLDMEDFDSIDLDLEKEDLKEDGLEQDGLEQDGLEQDDLEQEKDLVPDTDEKEILDFEIDSPLINGFKKD